MRLWRCMPSQTPTQVQRRRQKTLAEVASLIFFFFFFSSPKLAYSVCVCVCKYLNFDFTVELRLTLPWSYGWVLCSLMVHPPSMKLTVCRSAREASHIVVEHVFFFFVFFFSLFFFFFFFFLTLTRSRGILTGALCHVQQCTDFDCQKHHFVCCRVCSRICVIGIYGWDFVLWAFCENGGRALVSVEVRVNNGHGYCAYICAEL